jgi:uncharacterized protein
MPVALTYPGVYIEELPSAVRTIASVATSITAFIGRALRGPTDMPVLVQSFADFTRVYGGLWVESTLGYAVQQFFLNGGGDALIVRAQRNGAAATATLPVGLGLIAASEGGWGTALRARVDHNTRPPEPGEDPNTLFNVSVKDTGTGTIETFRNVSTDPNNARFITHVLKQQSQLIRVTGNVPALRPAENTAAPPGTDPFLEASTISFVGAALDGVAITPLQVVASLPLLDKADLFNLLCIPPCQRDPTLPDAEVDRATWDAAVKYAKDRRAFVIVDAPSAWASPADAIAGLPATVTPSDSAAIYFPRLLISDALKENRLDSFAACGVVAGIYARTDAQRGVWKAPAGIEASLQGVSGLSLNGEPGTLTDGDSGQLNPLGINCLRSFPVVGTVVWGARTLDGADRLASQWKYVPVRRLAYFIEESLFRGTQWVVFEPNDEPLWAQIRLNVGAFMQTLFRQGAFQGSTPKDAYFVKCSGETTTQTDIDNGIVNIIVGFAPLKPAEFVVIQIQQISPQA